MHLKYRSCDHRIFTKFLLSYLAILSAVMVIFIFNINIPTQTVKKDVQENDITALRQRSQIIDEKLENINLAANQIATNSDIYDFTQSDNSANDLYIKLQSVSNELGNYKLKMDNSFIYDYFVFFKNSDYIVTPDTCYKADFFYDSVAQNMNMSYSDWYDKLLCQKHFGDFTKTVTMNYEGKPYSCIFYTMTIPYNARDYNTETLAILIRTDFIRNLFNNESLTGGWLTIQDQNKNTIATFCSGNTKTVSIKVTDQMGTEGSFTRKIGGKNMNVTYAVSPKYGWRYIWVIPENIAMNEFNTLRTNMILIYLAALCLGFAIAFYLAYSNSRPVAKIVRNIRESIGLPDGKQSGNTFAVIDRSFSTLINNKKNLENQILQQRPILLNTITENLLSGKYGTQREIEINTEYVGIDLKANGYIAFVLHVFGRDYGQEISDTAMAELSTIRILIMEEIKKQFQNKVLFYQTDIRTTAVIIWSSSIDFTSDRMFETVREISEKFIQNYRLQLLIGIGNLYTSALYIWKSYQESLDALQFVQLQKKCQIIRFEDMPKFMDDYFYPVDLEQRLINGVHLGDKQKVADTFSIIINENFKNRDLSSHAAKELFEEIKGTIIKLKNAIPKDDEFLERVKNLKFDRLSKSNFENLLSVLKYSCEIIDRHKSKRNTLLIQHIMDYVNENYQNHELGLTLVASEFNISEGYLSYFFKENTGHNFTDFVEQVRISKACKLLTESKMSINDICESIGYNNVRSFRRAFKRIKGINPTSLRKENAI